MKKRKSKLHNRAATCSVLKRYFGDMPVRDATKELRVFGLQTDVAAAVPGDPEECVFAQSCKRMFQCTKAVFLRGVAYLDLVQADGSRAVERFVIPKKMAQLILDFDETGKSPEAGFVLRPPAISDRLDEKRRKERTIKRREYKRKKWQEYQKRHKARLIGTYVESATEKAFRESHDRFGTGLVHFNRDEYREVVK